ncbi:MAG TPA: diguanylate cyclase [Candidatus Acidoferrum sp.]|nr:diguanylate cyclase [Candidatus Acidoferrum sp.]
MDRARRLGSYAMAALVLSGTVAVVVGLTLVGLRRIESGMDAGRRAFDVRRVQRDAMFAMIDEETGVRGYVATGNAAFLAPYQNAVVRLGARQEPSVDDAATQAALRRFSRSADENTRFFRDEIALVEHGQVGTAQHHLPEGKASFDALREADAQVMGLLDRRLLATRSATRDELHRTFAFVVTTGIVLVAGVLLCLSLLARMRWNAALARRDVLTGLPNRRAFEERFEDELLLRHPQGTFVLLAIDLDGFKAVNDTCGHQIGDEVLADCARRLRRALRPQDFVARVGGDEFAALLPRARQAEVELIVRRIREQIERPVTVGGTTFALGASIGVAVAPYDGADAASLIGKADEAMYQAKRNRRSASASA